MAKFDMFLKVVGAKTGAIKGESTDEARPGEIDVVGWSWGMHAQTSMVGGGTASKASVRELSIRKKIDSATTALMSAMSNNEVISKAVLTVRKAGAKPVDYLIVTLERGRITTIDVESVNDSAPDLVERMSLSFQRISIEYVAQSDAGQGKGSKVFETDFLSPS